jgi:hypothetical protein
MVCVAKQLPDGEKGLENNQGQYNCFINVVIQALWHLTGTFLTTTPPPTTPSHQSRA